MKPVGRTLRAESRAVFGPDRAEPGGYTPDVAFQRGRRGAASFNEARANSPGKFCNWWGLHGPAVRRLQ